MVHEMNQMTLFSRHRIRTLAVLRSSTLPLGHGGPPPQYLVLRMDGEETYFYDNKNIMIGSCIEKPLCRGGGVNISVNFMISGKRRRIPYPL